MFEMKHGLLSVGFCMATWALTPAFAADDATKPDARTAAMDFAVAAAAGDDNAVTRALAVTDKQEDVLKFALSQIVLNAGKYEKAMATVFGTAAVGQYGVATGDEAAAWMKATADGDRVTLPLGQRPTTLTLVRQDGRWKMTFAAVAAYYKTKGIDLTVPADEPLRRWAEVAAAFEAAAKDVRAGRYADAKAAASATKQAVEDAARGANAN